MQKPRPATAQKEKPISKRRLEETVTKLQTALGQFTFEQAAVLPPPLAKIRELEAENARLMRENHDLHRMLSDTTAPAANREYKRRKIDIGTGEVYIARLLLSFSFHVTEGEHAEPAGSSHDALTRLPPLTVPDSPLHPHPHHYDPRLPSTPRCTSPMRATAISHHNGTSGLAFHLPDSPPYYDDGLDEHVRDHGHAHGAPLSSSSTPHTHMKLDVITFSHPHSPIDGVHNGNAHEHAYDTHNSWRSYAESERGPGAGAAGVGMGTL
ncbi:hypothetical protein B0H13DRAFT_2662621 [Mycena leptocephala]|nr:hypothetical protein B0H13DRAFT_2662621 [Mycena leptocephala]